MPTTRPKEAQRLRKELGLRSVFAISTGTTLSAGFFLLPGLAAKEAGPAVVLSYLLAATFLVPPLFSVVELSTAMPRAGGAYYFLDRSLGPLVGTIGGLATWLVLVLKTSFALIGMGAYVDLFVPEVPILPLALGFAVLFALVNLIGAGTAGSAQVVLVTGLLGILGIFIVGGIPHLQTEHFRGFFDHGVDSVVATAGMVYVSYVGVTHVASVSEEVADPERNLPRGLFLSMLTIVLVYGIGTTVIVGLVPAAELHGDLTPVATAARVFLGAPGVVLISGAALLAFSSVANAGILSASRYPLAMSRDDLLPERFGVVNARGIPTLGVYVTMGAILLSLLLFDPVHLARLASAFQLLVLAALSFAVIVMREARIESYDPGYRTPLYPWMQIVGILGPLWLISEMGWIATLPATALLGIGAGWYAYYGRDRVEREGALYHIFERLGHRRFAGLDRELRGILKEKGLRDEDPFEDVIMRAVVLDLPGEVTLEEATRRASAQLGPRLPVAAEKVAATFLDGARFGATPVAGGAALPHLRLAGLERSEMALVRVRDGLRDERREEVWGEHVPAGPIYALFFLASPEEDPAQHLRLLAEIARRIDDERFLLAWRSARNEHELKQILLREERVLFLRLDGKGVPGDWIDRPLRDLELPEGCLVALIRRREEVIIPRGSTVLRRLDHLTVIGEPQAIAELRRRIEQIEPAR
jgi:basic amino acid/polyamine antiporter, APA family